MYVCTFIPVAVSATDVRLASQTTTTTSTAANNASKGGSGSASASASEGTVPVLCSHCPGWVCYAEKRHPESLPYIRYAAHTHSHSHTHPHTHFRTHPHSHSHNHPHIHPHTHPHTHPHPNFNPFSSPHPLPLTPSLSPPQPCQVVSANSWHCGENYGGGDARGESRTGE